MCVCARMYVYVYIYVCVCSLGVCAYLDVEIHTWQQPVFYLYYCGMFSSLDVYIGVFAY